MLFSFNLQSSVLLIFFTHLLVYAALCARRSVKQQSNADAFLSVFLFAAAFFIVPWMTGFAGWYDNNQYRDILFYTPFVHGFFMGPALYFYVKSITNYTFRFSRKEFYHFIPGILYIIWSLVVVVADKFIAGKYYLMNGVNDPDFDSWYRFAWLISLAVYLALSIRHYLQYTRLLPHVVSFSEMVKFKWLRNFLYAFILLTVITILTDTIALFYNIKYTETWYYFVVFSVIVYYIAISGYNTGRVPLKSLRFDTGNAYFDGENETPLLLTTTAYEEKDSAREPQDANKPSPELMALRDRLQELMEKEKLYQEPELTLSDVAKKLQTNISVLSKVINQCFMLNFNDYINKQRVEDVTVKMNDPRFDNQTLLSIAFDAGFNSKSTFNRAFLKFMQTTPKNYYLSLKKNAADL